MQSSRQMDRQTDGQMDINHTGRCKCNLVHSEHFLTFESTNFGHLSHLEDSLSLQSLSAYFTKGTLTRFPIRVHSHRRVQSVGVHPQWRRMAVSSTPV